MLLNVYLLTLAAGSVDAILDAATRQSPKTVDAKLSCNLPGYGARSGGDGGYYRYLPYTNIAACQELCRRDSDCRSLSSYDKGGFGNCYLYKVPADQVVRTAYAGYYVFDKECNRGNGPQDCFLPGYGGAEVGINGYIEEIENITVSICRSRCDANPVCSSFSGYDENENIPGTCYIYSRQAKSITRLELEGYAIYAKGCDVSAPPKCNLAGWGSLSNGEFGYYQKIAGKTLAECQTTCRKDIGCQAFSAMAGRASTGNCYLYAVPADYVYRTPYNGYGVFDLRCPV